MTTTITLPASAVTGAASASSTSPAKGLPREKIIAIAAGAGGAVLLILIAVRRVQRPLGRRADGAQTAIFCIRRKRRRDRDSFRMRTNNLRTSIMSVHARL